MNVVLTLANLPNRRRFKADEILALVDAGVLSEDDPVELISGDLIVVSPQGPQHRTIIVELSERLRRAYAEDVHVQTHVPLAAAVDSLPEPDLAVVVGRPRDYMDRHPGGDETILVVEVAVTSHEIDRAKAVVYATAGVPEYWLIDLPGRCVEVYRHPREDGAYGMTSVLSDSEEIAVPGADVCWAVMDLLP